MGIARLALAGLAVVALLTLVGFGARALLSAMDTPEVPQAAATSAASSSPQQVPTLRIECAADVCPHVVVRVPGGDVLQNRDMAAGEEVSFFDEELDVVLEDASTVRVTENGTPRPQGKPGEREEFTVTR